MTPPTRDPRLAAIRRRWLLRRSWSLVGARIVPRPVRLDVLYVWSDEGATLVTRGGGPLTTLRVPSSVRR